jgi:hypothetical protein
MLVSTGMQIVRQVGSAPILVNVPRFKRPLEPAIHKRQSRVAFNARNSMSFRTAAITALLLVSISQSSLHAQIPVAEVEAIGGPWECVDADGVHGILISASTGLKNKAIDWQSLTVLIYQRGPQNRMGYFVPGREDKVATLDERRLDIHFKGQPNLDSRHLPAFEMQIRFDPIAKLWSGTWSLCKRPGGAVLERPVRRSGAPEHALQGDWKGASDPGIDSSLVSFSISGSLLTEL